LWAVGLGLLGAAGLIKATLEARRQAIFGLGWFLIGLLPVLNIAPLINEYSLIQAAEHFVYFPLIGVLLVGAVVMPTLMRTVSRRVVIAAAMALVLACGMLTARQLPFWRSETALFERSAQFEPGFGRVRLLLARAYSNADRFDEAIAEYSTALQIMSGYVTKVGSSHASRVYTRFIKEIYFDRGQAFLSKGDIRRSTQDYWRSLAMKLPVDTRGQDSRTFNSLAFGAVRLGDMATAKRYFQLAVMLDGNNVDALNNLGVFFLGVKDKNMARFWFERALKVRPGFGTAWENLKKLK
jgi:Tfp pilus assembly protein PilF